MSIHLSKSLAEAAPRANVGHGVLWLCVRAMATVPGSAATADFAFYKAESECPIAAVARVILVVITD